MRFTRHIGIHHSGAQAPESRLERPQVYESRNGGTPGRISTAAERDACCIAAWLAEMDRRGTLDYYLKPPLSLSESRKSRLEGWILGVC